MNREFIDQLTEIVQANLADENFGPEQLAEKFGVSHSTLHRKLKDTLDKTISQFIREIRLKKAGELLLDDNLTIAEIAYRVGFGSATYFNKCFHNHFGVTPGEFKKQDRGKNKESFKSALGIKKVLLFIITPVLVLTSIFLFLNEKYSFLGKPRIEKSIAVLPVKYLGPPEYQYQAEGTLEEIQNNLAKIKDLRVLDKNSMEQYRSTNKTDKKIGKELNVGALLRITFEKENEDILLFVKLLRANDGSLLFSKKYPGTREGLFSMQSKIAETIALELEAEITKEEKQRIEKIPTLSLTANDFYLRAREEQWKFEINKDQQALQKAINLYSKALQYDSTYAPVYTGMALLDWHRNVWKRDLSEKYLDSVLWLANKAISLDKDIADAYLIRGDYNRIKGYDSLAFAEYDKAIQLNPNSWMAYFRKARLFDYEDLSKSIPLLYTAASLHKGIMLPTILWTIGSAYGYAGFQKEANHYKLEAFKLDNDSVKFFLNNMEHEDVPSKILSLEKALAIDSNNTFVLRHLAEYCSFSGRDIEAFNYLERFIDAKGGAENLRINSLHRVGYIYLKQGFKDQAEYYFNLHERSCIKAIETGRYYSNILQYDLAGAYAFRGEKEKAYYWLHRFNQMKYMPYWMPNLIKIDPLFDALRDEAEFKQIVAEVEFKYHAQHEQVRKWLEENNIHIN